MPNRRAILKALGRLFLWGCAALGSASAFGVSALAKIKKRIVPRNEDPDRLRNANPRHLDTQNLEVMPLEALESVGDKESPYTISNWQLRVGGAVAHPQDLDYEQILAMPAIERDVLLICPGIFAFHGRWKGASLEQIIDRAAPLPNATALIVHGYSRSGQRKERFTLETLVHENIFLAYHVNGRPLAAKHGFPLRVVAPGHWGEQWMKFVNRIEVV